MRRSSRRMLLLVMLVALCLVSVPQMLASQAARGRVVASPGAVPARPVALVLGAGLHADGRPTPMLADRVAGAVELYRSGAVGHLLLSGDNGSADYDEPTSMRRLALDAGVPADAITLDHAGFSTFDSCARAEAVFGVTAAVVVTQDFHATRAVATCRAAGIDAVGLGLSSARYSRSEVAGLRLRERAATIKASWDDLRGADPYFGGPYVGLPGSAKLPTVNQRWDERLVALG